LASSYIVGCNKIQALSLDWEKTLHQYQKRSSSPNLAAKAYQKKIADPEAHRDAEERIEAPPEIDRDVVAKHHSMMMSKLMQMQAAQQQAEEKAAFTQADAAKTGEEGQGVQAKGDWQQKADTNAIFSNGSALPPAVMAKYENLMPGVSLEHVSLHQGSQVDAALGAAKLHGLTDGTNIAVSSKAPSGTLEHEIGHVGQRQEKGFSFNEVNRQAYEADADNISANLLSDRPVERFEQTVGKVQLSGGVEKEGDEYENNANAVAAKVAAGESAEHGQRNFSEPNSGKKQSQGRSPTDQHLTSSELSQTIANTSDKVPRGNDLGISNAENEKYKDALTNLEKALKSDPNNSQLWFNRGWYLYKLRRFKDSKDSNEIALKVDTNWGMVDPSYAWNNLGVSLYHLGDYNKALEAFKKAVDMNSKYELAQNNLTFLRNRLRLSNNSSLINPSNTSSRDNPVERFKDRLRAKAIAKLEENRGLIKKAQDKYQNPENAEALGRLRQVVEADERLKKAQDLLTIRQRTNPESWRDNDKAPVIKNQSDRQALIDQNNAKLNDIKQVRYTLLQLYPASGLLGVGDVKPTNNDTELRDSLNKRFKDILGDIEKAAQGINSGDIRPEKLDQLVADTLKETPEADIAAVNSYLQGVHQRDNTFRFLGFLAEIGLGVAAIFTGGFVGAVMGAIATIMGIGQSIYEFEEADDLNTVAKTGEAGGNQLVADPDAAQFNYVMGWVHVVLAGLEGLSLAVEGAGILASNGLRGSEQIVNVPGAEVLARVTPEQIWALERARQLQEAQRINEASSILARLKDDLGPETYEQLQKVWDAAAVNAKRVPNVTSIQQLRQQLPRQIGLVESAGLESGQVRVSYTTEVKIEYAPNASLDNIRAHVPTARDLLEIKNNENSARSLLNTLNQWLGRPEANAYSQALEAKMEIEKHIDLIYQNAREVASLRPNSAEAQDLLSQIADYQGQIAYWADVINKVDRSLGRGYVAGARSRGNWIRITEQGEMKTFDKEVTDSIQVSSKEVRALSNKNIPKTEYQSLIGNLGQKNVLTLIQRLDGVWFARIYRDGGGEGALRVILEIMDLEAKGKVKGFNDWLKFARDKNKQGDDLINVVAELREAKRLAAEVKADEVINVGGDAQVVPRRDGSTPQSYDITVVDRQGQVRRNIDVTSIQKVVIEAEQFKEGIKHAIDKVGEAKGIKPKDGATVEATIQVEIPNNGDFFTIPPNNRVKTFGDDGRYIITEFDGTARIIGTAPTGGRIRETKGDLFDDIVTQTQKNGEANRHLSRINIVDRSGKSIVIIEKINGNWQARRTRRN
jgi:tetratricopeptide (TPR) repeat protein